MTTSPSTILRPSPQAKQQGVVLIVVLVMLVIMGLASAQAMRTASSTDRVAQGSRSFNQATQYAQLALKYCETQISNPTTREAIMLQPSPGETDLWKKKATWFSSSKPITSTLVPAAQLAMASTDLAAGVAAPPAPQCVAECVRLGGVGQPQLTCAEANDAVVVTARGYSGDFVPDSDGAAKSGTVVWVQSTIRLR